MELVDEKPICLVEVIEHPSGSGLPFELRVNPEALEIIETIRDKMVSLAFCQNIILRSRQYLCSDQKEAGSPSCATKSCTE